MGAYRSAMMPLQGHVEDMVSMTGIPPHHMGVPVFPQHLLSVMPGFPGMSYFGKSAVIATHLPRSCFLSTNLTCWRGYLYQQAEVFKLLTTLPVGLLVMWLTHTHTRKVNLFTTYNRLYYKLRNKHLFFNDWHS